MNCQGEFACFLSPIQHSYHSTRKVGTDTPRSYRGESVPIFRSPDQPKRRWMRVQPSSTIIDDSSALFSVSRSMPSAAMPAPERTKGTGLPTRVA